MDRFIPAQLACVRYLASERSLELHARRGNLPFRGEPDARLYDATVLPLLFLPRSAGTALPDGTLGAVRMGESFTAAIEKSSEPDELHRRRRRVSATTGNLRGALRREAQEA